jgi:hypothetical protein
MVVLQINLTGLHTIKMVCKSKSTSVNPSSPPVALELCRKCSITSCREVHTNGMASVWFCVCWGALWSYHHVQRHHLKQYEAFWWDHVTAASAHMAQQYSASVPAGCCLCHSDCTSSWWHAPEWLYRCHTLGKHMIPSYASCARLT